MYATRIYFYLGILAILSSCSSIFHKSRQPVRIPASMDLDCAGMLDSVFTPNDVEKWSPKRIARIFEHPDDLNKFYDYLNLKYPLELRQQIGDIARRINGIHEQRIYTNFFRQLEMAKRSPHLKLAQPNHGWANKTWAYLYVDKFGVQAGNEKASFDDFIANLDYYKEKLGVSNLYLLPINKSPKMDAGYDVSDYQSIDELIGGHEGFQKFIKAARKKDLNVMVDFVPGHTSYQHEWFQKALNGDPKYQNYFINSPSDIPGEILSEGGNVYRVYKTKEGKEYKRLLLFPDLETKHWHKESLSNNSDHYFYSSFYPFQKDLNLQNPDVLDEHLNTLGWWLNQGVNGIRADAISWWVKLEGTSGQHLPETLAVSEYFNTFLKYLNKESIFLPELVDAPETAARYLGKTMNLNGSVGGSNANALFEFEKSVQILYAGISGDFTDHYKFLNRTRAIEYPENTLHMLYSGNHHDEIYLGFLSPDAKKNFQNIVKKSDGVVYKKGNSAGAMLSDLVNHDENQMYQFYKFLFGHQGTVAIYQGAELGLGNAWKETYKVTLTQLEDMVKAGRLDANHPALAELKAILKDPNAIIHPPKEDGDLLPLIDGRLLHRNKITQNLLDKAKNGENTFFNRFSHLPKLKESNPALNGNGVEEPLETLRSDIGSFMRRAYSKDGSLTQEVAVIKNGSAEHTTVRLRRDQLTSKNDFHLKELETNTLYNFNFIDEGTGIEITLEPYQTLWLDVIP